MLLIRSIIWIELHGEGFNSSISYDIKLKGKSRIPCVTWWKENQLSSPVGREERGESECMLSRYSPLKPK